MPANSMVDLEHVIDLHDICASAAQCGQWQVLANKSIALASQPIYLSNWLPVIYFQ